MPYPWTNTEQPPPMAAGAATYDISTVTPTVIGAGSGGDGYAAGPVTRIVLGDNDDAFIVQSVFPHTIPVHVIGGRNVIYRGLHLEMVTQPGNGVGQLDNNNCTNCNVHPRLTGNSGIRCEQWATTWIEGCHLDMTGHQCDVTSQHNPSGLTNTVAKTQRNWMLINSWAGNQRSDSDAIHGDIVQNRNFDTTRRGGYRCRTENATMRGIGNGVTMQSADTNDAHYIREYVRSNFEDGDTGTYTPKSRGLLMDQAARGGVTGVIYDDLYVNWKQDATGNFNYWYVKDGGRQRVDAGVQAGTFATAPPGGDFAPTSDVGQFYQSPFVTQTALDSPAKRLSVIGVARPWLRTHKPAASLDEAWRVSVGHAYSGNALTPSPPSAFLPTWAINSTVTIVGGSG